MGVQPFSQMTTFEIIRDSEVDMIRRMSTITYDMKHHKSNEYILDLNPSLGIRWICDSMDIIKYELRAIVNGRKQVLKCPIAPYAYNKLVLKVWFKYGADHKVKIVHKLN
jgi:hypothetical protein